MAAVEADVRKEKYEIIKESSSSNQVNKDFLDSSSQIGSRSGEGKENYFFLSSPTLLENERFIDQKLREIESAEKNQTSPIIRERNHEDHQVRFIKHLEDEVFFLREELQNKNSIIKLLLSDIKMLDNVNFKLQDFTNVPSQKHSTSLNDNFTEENDKPFEIPKRTSKQNDPLLNTSKIKLNNRYSLLTNHAEIDINNELKDDNDCTINENVTIRKRTNKHKSKSLANTSENQVDKESLVQNTKNQISSSNRKPCKSLANTNENLTEKESLEQDANNQISSSNRKQGKIISILGDSMIQGIKGYELATDSTKIYVKSFPGAKTSCMKHYLIPTAEKKPDLIILHCGTNDLSSNDSPNKIANRIINLASDVSHLSCDTAVAVSTIIPRNDRHNDKAMDVNKILLDLCNERNIGMITHKNIDKKAHLNRSRLHLNSKGTKILKDNLRIFTEN